MGLFKSFTQFFLIVLVALFAASMVGGFIGVMIYKNEFFTEFSKFFDLSVFPEDWWFLKYLLAIPEIGILTGGYIGVSFPLYFSILAIVSLFLIFGYLIFLISEIGEKKEKQTTISSLDVRSRDQILRDEIERTLFGSGKNIDYMSDKELREELRKVNYIIQDMSDEELRKIAKEHIDELEALEEEEEEEEEW
jgi:hypothetical protein